MLINVNKMLTNLGQTGPCVTVDESIYAIAKTIQWQVLADITIRLRIVGKRMKSSGFKEIISQFQLFGCTNIEGTFSFFIKINVFSK